MVQEEHLENKLLLLNILFSEAENIVTGGIGFRYLLAKKFGLRVGIDITKSKENEAFFIQVGSAWKGF